VNIYGIFYTERHITNIVQYFTNACWNLETKITFCFQFHTFERAAHKLNFVCTFHFWEGSRSRFEKEDKNSIRHNASSLSPKNLTTIPPSNSLFRNPLLNLSLNPLILLLRHLLSNRPIRRIPTKHVGIKKCHENGNSCHDVS